MHTQVLPSLPAQDAALDTAQRDIELRASSQGYDRYIKRQKSSIDNVGGHAGAEAVKIIRGSIPLVSAKIATWMEAQDHGGRGKRTPPSQSTSVSTWTFWRS